MKRIDSKTQSKLYWLFTPMAIVVVLEMCYLWYNVNLLEQWFGIKLDILAWCKPALIGSLLIVFIGQSIAAIRQKCWGELTVTLVFLVVILLNMTDFIAKLFVK